MIAIVFDAGDHYPRILFVEISRSLRSLFNMQSSSSSSNAPTRDNISRSGPDIASFGRRKYVSTSALSGVLAEIREFGLPEHSSRRTIKRARDNEFNDATSTPYGCVIRTVDIGKNDRGVAVAFWYADPRSNLYYMIRSCDRLRAFILRTLELHPCSPTTPWTVILYDDEIVAGNVLLRHNPRKSWAYYYSFLEFGAAALSSEFLWFTLTVSKSDTVTSIVGHGRGMLFKEMALTLSPFRVEGFVCGDIMIWANRLRVIGDGDALKHSMDLKGASGHFKCPLCSNVVSMQAARKANLAVTDMVYLAELDVSKFQAHSDESFINNAKFLESQKPLKTKAQFKALETSLGLNYAPDGVLLCDNLEFKITNVGYDYQHVYLVHGIFQWEAGMLLDRLKSEPAGPRNVRHADIHRWFQPFVWPKVHRRSSNGQNVFEVRSDKGGSISCSASEGLGCFLLLQLFLSIAVFDGASDHVKAACCSYYALCTVLVMLTMAARDTVTPEQLMNAIVTHLSLHKAAYGESHWKPKMHWALHLPDQLRFWRILIACFVHERKHKEVKRYLEGRFNPKFAFDRNVLQDVLHVQMLALNECMPYPTGSCLIAPKNAKPQTQTWVQSHMQCAMPVCSASSAKASNFVTVSVEDVVCVDWDGTSICVGQVFMLFSIGGSLFAGVRIWPRTPQLNMYNTIGLVYIVRLEDILDVCIYTIQGGIALVVPPRGTAV